MDLLNPAPQQERQRQRITAQQMQAEAELAKQLRDRGQNASNQPFTSPWQVAGQWANALAGRSKQNQLAGDYAGLTSLQAPGGEAAGASMPAAASAPAGQPSAAPAASAAPSQGSQRQAAFSPEIEQAILEGSQAAGVNPQFMARLVRTESNGNPHAATGSYFGLAQVSADEMKRVSGGQGNVWNPKDSVMAAGMIAKENAQHFQNATGRQADPFDLYMMHQQGPAGYLAHISNPGASAVQNMANTGEGRAKGPKWAQAAITGNLGQAGDTSQQFIDRWRQRWGRADAGDHTVFSDEFHKSNTPQTSPMIERGSFVPDEMLRQAAPTYSMERLQRLAASGQLSPEQIKAFNAEIQTSMQPKSADFAGGKVVRDSKTGQQIYMPTLQTKPIELPGGLKTQQTFWIDSRGKQHYADENGQPQGGGNIASQPAPGGLGAALRSGDIDRMNQAGIQSAADLEGAKKGSEQAATSMAAVVRGARGLGTTGAKIESLANDMHEVVSDPKWSQGGGMAGTRQALSRLTSSLGLDPNAATPRGVIEQASKILKLYQMEALKTGTSELGENAGRVFQTEAETLGEIAPTGEETQQEMLAKLKTLSRLGGHWRELGDRVDEHVAKNGGKPTNDVFRMLREHESGFHLLPPSRNKESTGAAPPSRNYSTGHGADMPLPPMPGGTTPNGVKWKLVQ